MSDIVEAVPDRSGFLDTVAARLLALLVAIGVGYLLYLSHMHYQGFTSGGLAGVDKAQYDTCIRERMAAFERVAEGAGYSEQQRDTAVRAARASANAICAEMARPTGGLAPQSAAGQ